MAVELNSRIVINELATGLEEPGFKSGVEAEETEGNESTVTPYDPRRINIINKEMTGFQVLRKIKSKEIILNPDFQRNVVWNDIRQSKLIESIFIRIPLPSFYLDATNDDKWLVIDGLQRLTTLNRYVNENAFALTGLEFFGDNPEIEGKRFSELPRYYQRLIEEASLFLFIVRPETPPEAKFTIFRRINTGGIVLNSQEIRHCLYQGKATMLLKELSKTAEFKSATDDSISDERMADRESILRFLAFRIKSYQNYKKPEFDEFLGKVMREINIMPDQEILTLKQDFIQAMNKALIVFAGNAFRKMYALEQKRNPINKALFETWSVCLLPYDTFVLMKFKEKIVEKFIQVFNTDKEFEDSISQGTGDVRKVYKRFEVVETIIREAIK